jgi:hypothetical protein
MAVTIAESLVSQSDSSTCDRGCIIIYIYFVNLVFCGHSTHGLVQQMLKYPYLLTKHM